MAPVREPERASQIAPLLAKRRWRRLRATLAVLVTQLAILAAFLLFWEWMTASNRALAFMFGSPSAIANFLVQMVRDGSLWRDTSITGLETLLGFFVGNLIGTADRPVAVVFALRLARGRALRHRARLDSDHRAGADHHHLVRHRADLEGRDVDAVGRDRGVGHVLQGCGRRRSRSDQPDADAWARPNSRSSASSSCRRR